MIIRVTKRTLTPNTIPYIYSSKKTQNHKERHTALPFVYPTKQSLSSQTSRNKIHITLPGTFNINIFSVFLAISITNHVPTKLG
jgi:hypothetical protein